MNYNWGDPKKNSLLSSRMMAKAEVTRNKRLTSVKSTLSNQLHPAIENKLRKKKKAADSARHLNGDDNKSHDNNDTHDDKAEPQLTSDDESDTIRQDVFPLPTCASFSVAMFDEFDQHAAADGLFHPASTIEAFAEHDAKYRQEIKSASGKSRSGPRRARTGSEYPPSRENHRLPVLHSGKTRRGSTRQESKQRGSAPASMTSTSSLSKLTETKDRKHSLSAAHSDSNLYAPRRLGVVPSSADRSALDFLEREFESDKDNNPHNSPVTKSSRAVSKLDNNEVPDNSSSVVPQLDFSLARKFEQLKEIMKSNREKHNSARQNGEQLSNEANGAIAQSTARSKASSRSDQDSAKSSIRASRSGSSATKNGETKPKGILKKRSTPAARARTNMSNCPSGSTRVPVAARKTSSSVAVAIAHPIQSNKQMKVRSGVSLLDLKAEHREALEMLKELGGPMDPDYLHIGADLNTSKGNRMGRNTTRTTGMNRSTIAHPDRKSENQLHARDSSSTPPTSSNSTVSMVTKLRESISSGRSRESSPRLSSSPATSDGPRVLSVQKGEAGSTVSESMGSNQVAAAQGESSGDAPDKASLVGPRSAVHRSFPLSLSPNKSSSDPWKQYEDDIVDDEDGDNNQKGA